MVRSSNLAPHATDRRHGHHIHRRTTERHILFLSPSVYTVKVAKGVWKFFFAGKRSLEYDMKRVFCELSTSAYRVHTSIPQYSMFDPDRHQILALMHVVARQFILRADRLNMRPIWDCPSRTCLVTCVSLSQARKTYSWAVRLLGTHQISSPHEPQSTPGLGLINCFSRARPRRALHGCRLHALGSVGDGRGT